MKSAEKSIIPEFTATMEKMLPMAGTVSSLNVSVATGICLYEAVRQRRPEKGP